MKHILFFLFLPAILTAQRTVTIDSTWISNNAGIFFENRLVSYDSGESTTTVTRLGDTSQVAGASRSKIESRAGTLASDAVAVSGFRKEITELIRQAGGVETLIGAANNPLKKIAVDRVKILTDTAWQWKIDTTTVVWSITAAKQARYKVGSQAIRNASILGDVIRLANYGGNGNLDVYRISESRYTSLDGSVVIRRVKKGQNREVLPEPAAPPPPDSIDNALLLGGHVLALTKKTSTWTTTDGTYNYTITRKLRKK